MGILLNIPEAIFYLLKGDYEKPELGCLGFFSGDGEYRGR